MLGKLSNHPIGAFPFPLPAVKRSLFPPPKNHQSSLRQRWPPNSRLSARGRAKTISTSYSTPRWGKNKNAVPCRRLSKKVRSPPLITLLDWRAFLVRSRMRQRGIVTENTRKRNLGDFTTRTSANTTYLRCINHCYRSVTWRFCCFYTINTFPQSLHLLRGNYGTQVTRRDDFQLL